MGTGVGVTGKRLSHIDLFMGLFWVEMAIYIVVDVRESIIIPNSRITKACRKMLAIFEMYAASHKKLFASAFGGFGLTILS